MSAPEAVTVSRRVGVVWVVWEPPGIPIEASYQVVCWPWNHWNPGGSGDIARPLSKTACTVPLPCELTARPTMAAQLKLVNTTGSPTCVQFVPSDDIEPMKVLFVRTRRNQVGTAGWLTFVTTVAGVGSLRCWMVAPEGILPRHTLAAPGPASSRNIWPAGGVGSVWLSTRVLAVPSPSLPLFAYLYCSKKKTKTTPHDKKDSVVI